MTHLVLLVCNLKAIKAYITIMTDIISAVLIVAYRQHGGTLRNKPSKHGTGGHNEITDTLQAL